MYLTSWYCYILLCITGTGARPSEAEWRSKASRGDRRGSLHPAEGQRRQPDRHDQLVPPGRLQQGLGQRRRVQRHGQAIQRGLGRLQLRGYSAQTGES